MAAKRLTQEIVEKFMVSKHSAVEANQLDGDAAPESLCKQLAVLALTGVLLLSLIHI